MIDSGLGVPSDRPLADLTAELTAMLGSADPAERDRTAYPTLATWIDRGVYDDLLAGLGDGIAAGLATGLGESGTDTVFRRSFSALLLGECIARDSRRALVPGGKILDWGDRIVSWYLRERDDRGFVDGKGWAHAVAHGADAIGMLADSPHLAAPELTVLLDVLADRVLTPGGRLLVSGEPDRIAEATLRVLRRNALPLAVVEPWVRRVAARATAYPSETQDPYRVTGNPEAFLRALHLQLALAPDPPQMRPDLLLVLVDALRQTNPGLRARR
ncbi:DUF2785 domain-containing protein [Nocardioides sp. CPCC 205120]|uniref:DUF2785 domain-containing protein n=1 Tax=Nocardioides sp. CPCC 205120 TaxID=3406462 RepID=UPI003B50ABC9